MSEAAIRQKIFETISGAGPDDGPAFASPDLGMVHRYERWSKDWGKFIQLFKDPFNDRIFGWEICRPTLQAIKLSKIEEQVAYSYKVQGYMAVKDEDLTDELFNAKVEALRDLFLGNHNLGGTCTDAGPAIVPVNDTRMFGSVLCHYCEIVIPATEIRRKGA